MIACDGFVGNALLKSSEALAEGPLRACGGLHGDLVTKMAGIIALPALQALRQEAWIIRIRRRPLLGVKGITIIGHGRTTTGP